MNRLLAAFASLLVLPICDWAQTYSFATVAGGLYADGADALFASPSDLALGPDGNDARRSVCPCRRVSFAGVLERCRAVRHVRSRYYSARVTSRVTGDSGVVLTEVYDRDSAGATSRVVNVSSLGLVGPNAQTDAALVVRLPPGGFSLAVSGVLHTSGRVLVEIYDLDS